MLNKNKKSRFKSGKWKRIRTAINRFYWLISISTVVVILLISLSIALKYKNSVTWTKDDNSTPLASQTLDMLYDDDSTSKKAKQDFLSLSKQMLNDDGTITSLATKSNVTKLKKLLSQINVISNEINYQNIYAEITLKYALTRQYNDLFIDGSTTELKSSVSPATIAELNNSTYADINTLFMRNHDDKFVSDWLTAMNAFEPDIKTFNSLIQLFSQAVIIDGNTLTLQDGYHDDLAIQFTSTKSNLQYNWNSTEYMTRIVSLLNPVLEKVQSDYSAYANYEADMAEKELAYANWQQTQADFFAEVESIKQKALAEKAAKEEAARLAAELAEAKPLAKEKINNMINLTEEQKSAFVSAIDNATLISQVNNIVNNAQIENDRTVESSSTSDSSTSSSISTTDSSSTSDSSTSIETKTESSSSSIN